MSFVRKKTMKGQTYFYLVECLWEDGKPRQRVIAYLGRYATVRGAHAHFVRQTKKKQKPADAKHAKQMVRKLEKYI